MLSSEKKSKALITTPDVKKEENLSSNDVENQFFDSRSYRCCFNLFHAKIVTFVFCTLVLHEIVLGAIYLIGCEEFSRKELQILGVLMIRILQLPPTAIAYYSLWRCNPYLIIPFGVSQLCIGSFADIFTILRIIKDLENNNSLLLPFTGTFKIFNILIPLLIYIFLAATLIWVLYSCHIYFIAKKLHQKGRNMYKNEQKTQINNIEKFNGELAMLM